jgi:hypothetical protein
MPPINFDSLEQFSTQLFADSLDKPPRLLELYQLEDLLSKVSDPSLQTRVKNVASVLDEVRNVYRVNGIVLKDRAVTLIKLPPVTVELVRETFYNAILPAIESIKSTNFIEKSDIDNQESYLYPAIAALALLQVIESSKGTSEEIYLSRDNVLASNNCPLEIKPLVDALLKLKGEVSRLGDKDLLTLKQACINNPDNPVPDAYPKRDEIMRLAAKVNSVASQITQRDTFKATIDPALKVLKGFIGKQ